MGVMSNVFLDGDVPLGHMKCVSKGEGVESTYGHLMYISVFEGAFKRKMPFWVVKHQHDQLGPQFPCHTHQLGH